MNLDYWQGKRPGETVEMGSIYTAADYFKTLGMQIIAGRDFINVKSDTASAILNEAAVKRLRFEGATEPGDKKEW